MKAETLKSLLLTGFDSDYSLGNSVRVKLKDVEELSVRQLRAIGKSVHKNMGFKVSQGLFVYFIDKD